jgi:hypothetical protein
MLYVVLKAILSGLIVAAVSEVAKRYPTLGALILALPLISILAFIWLWLDTGDKERVASLAQTAFWFVLATLPMLLALPALLRSGLGFWPALTVACLLTISLYAIVWAVGNKTGARL